MGTVRNERTGEEKLIRGRALIGRAASSDIVLTAPGASNEHARIQWTGAEWMIRDLRSRNGTWVNEQLLIGAELRLVVSDRITFGEPSECWLWVEDRPPVAAATRVDGGVIEASGAVLFLPDDEFPLASIYPHGDGWELDIAGATREIHDREWVQAGSQHYCVHLPALDPSAQHTQTLIPRQRLVDAHLRFLVSMDEEHVTLAVETPTGKREISSKAFYYMLLVLARSRQADFSMGIPEPDAGWLYADDLATKLRIDITTLNVHVHRARRLLASATSDTKADLSFDDAYELVQRRSGQLRLGVARVTIEQNVSTSVALGTDPHS